MKAFKFSLQAVLDNAINQKNDCIVKLKDVLGKIKCSEDEKDRLLVDILSNESKLQEYSNISNFKQIKVYIEELLLEIEKNKREIDRLNTLRLQRLEELKQAKIKCSAFEKIKEKKYIQYLDIIKKFEEKEIEEFINYNYFVKAE